MLRYMANHEWLPRMHPQQRVWVSPERSKPNNGLEQHVFKWLMGCENDIFLALTSAWVEWEESKRC